ncbi:unnamed protein product [Cyprideis torosa]|uniref:Uncharacterized protein n=1 Tax=Cyprideis torosa TaxID=163714 RepID=A0A7R8WA65_9CRUS|nr:unnamed protein product [Cyprideis torosa]CAG0886031.1 unnamed protein product [Cyprideis torosa]
MAEGDRVTILLVGVTGSGKSSLGNVLLGNKHNKGPFEVGGSTRSVTENIQEETSNAFAGKEGRLIRIIDVRGYGDSEGRDKDFEEKMVKKWEELERVDGIIAVYNFSNPRLSQQDKSLFWSLCKAFGPGFLKHIIINVSQYKHSEEAAQEREEQGRSLDKFKEEMEQFLTKGISTLLRNSSLTAPFLAIDALYRERDRRQKEMFVKETDKLWQHIEEEHELGGLLSLKYINRRISEIQNELKKKNLSANEKADLNEKLKRLEETTRGQTKLSFTQWIAVGTVLGLCISNIYLKSSRDLFKLEFNLEDAVAAPWENIDEGGIQQALEWAETDKASFYDSDRFDDDSICGSNISDEPENVCNHWRGWKRPSNGNGDGSSRFYHQSSSLESSNVISPLLELAARKVASHIPFEVVETFTPPVPETLQLRIAYWSFPDSEDDIRLYCCLANGNAGEFDKGDLLFRQKSVSDAMQIGFHLSATVVVSGLSSSPGGTSSFSVAVTFDRCRVTCCSCTCAAGASWCCHIVAVCLYRIHMSKSVRLRAPISESLSRLDKNQLRKFAQYLINESPQQLLPIAQRLLDDLLSPSPSEINKTCGAPDPTAGAMAGETTTWCLDDAMMHNNIRKILVKFCIPSPIVFSDVNFLSSTAPPAATEWASHLRPLRGREPEGMWNLLQIVREMFRRHDSNAVPLLTIITEECLGCQQFLVWWFNTKVALHTGGGGGGGKQNVNSNAHGTQIIRQNACSALCDELVTLWRLAALNPALTASEKELMVSKFREWHLQVVRHVKRSRQSAPNNGNGGNGGKNTAFGRNDLEVFTGFKPAIEACSLDWSDFPLAGIVDHILYGESSLGCLRTSEGGKHQSIHSSQAVLMGTKTTGPQQRGRANSGGARNGSESDEGVPSPPDTSQQVTEDEGQGQSDAQANDEGTSSPPPVGAAIPPPPPQDEYQVYYFDPELRIEPSGAAKRASSAEESEARLFSNIKKIEEPLEILFARAEALHAHGHSREASNLAVKLANELLENPPDLMVNVPFVMNKGKKRRNKINPTYHEAACQVSATLSKCAFLCTVLSEVPAHLNLAFRVGLYGLEMARPPASTRALEVKLSFQEFELTGLLKKLHLGATEMNLLRERAEQLRNGTLKSRGDALLPLNLASFIFDSLVLNSNNRSISIQALRQPGDESLGFDAAVAALGLKANVSEFEHPLLCEGTRRQRGELAMNLLVHYKDDPERIARIMSKILDREIHQQYKAPTLSSSFYKSSGNSASHVPDDLEHSMSAISLEGGAVGGAMAAAVGGVSQHTSRRERRRERMQLQQPPPSSCSSGDAWVEDYQAWQEAQRRRASTGAARRGPGSDSGSSGKSSESMESSSLVETATPPTSTANNHQVLLSSLNHGPPPTHMSTSLLGAVPSSPQKINQPPLDCCPPMTSALTQVVSASAQTSGTSGSSSSAPGKVPRGFKGKRAYPTVPNQPSEASAHFMFELAKIVLAKAGGNSSTSLFHEPSTSQNHRGPHRTLHMCAFQIGLYALGLHNYVTPNWLSRTYSSHVSWITGQALEIGTQAIRFLMNTWEGHLTPPEAACLADRASRSREESLVLAAAELALSCLPHAHALNLNEIQRAIIQCKEQGNAFLEKGCLAVEQAAKGGGVAPEVLFEVARRWNELYLDHLGGEREQEGLFEVQMNNAPHADNGSAPMPPVYSYGYTNPTTIYPQYYYLPSLSPYVAPQLYVAHQLAPGIIPQPLPSILPAAPGQIYGTPTSIAAAFAASQAHALRHSSTVPLNPLNPLVRSSADDLGVKAKKAFVVYFH